MIKGQPNRLPDAAASLAGREIDRSKPLAFRLNGREIRGFAGDTVLSATIATGITQAGWRGEQPLALDDRFAPPVAPRDHARDRKAALPMDRLPAAAGLDLVSVGTRRRNPSEVRAFIASLFGGTAHSLEHEFGGAVDISAPWHDASPEERIETDVAVVGGGVAGLRAAIAAGSTGESVVLVERRQSLGGDARFIGSIDEEEAPATVIESLMDRVAALKEVTILLSTEAIGINGRDIRAHQVVAGDKPTGRVITIAAKRVVLAPGSFERLPIFPGNRVPGVTRAVAAFNLADRFGVWIGKTALFNTASGFAYRLAVEAQKAGLGIARIADTRLLPQSRFIDFSKAYGVPLSLGVAPRSASPSRGGELDVRLTEESHRAEPHELPFMTGQFVVCGGWQPELSLWHMAGGQSRWVPTANRMEPLGKVEGIEIVGAAAGWRSTTACLASAAAAVATLLGRRPEPVEDKLIDPAFETPDDPTPIASGSGANGIAYLDAGLSLAERPASSSRPKGLRGLFSKPDAAGQFLAQARALTVGDIAAAVQLGAVAAADAGTIAQERCVVAGDIVQIKEVPPAPGPLATPLDAAPYPSWLEGRFSGGPKVWRLESADKRTFETGCLVFTNSDKTDPLAAIGVVLRPERDGAAALIGGVRHGGDALVVRDLSGPVNVKLVEPPKLELPA
jgi:sarcosine oxidase subunit alpha